MGVFGDDFTTVDFGEELCQTQPPEKANSSVKNGRIIVQVILFFHMRTAATTRFRIRLLFPINAHVLSNRA